MNLSNYSEPKPRRLRRILWCAVNATIFRLAATRYLRCVRHGLLRLFGAEVDRDALIYASCKIFAPWNLKVGRACIGPSTELYNKAPITIGNDSVISQGSFLCTASHEISSLMLPLKTAPISIGNNVWVAADAFVGPGVEIADGAVVGARSVVTRAVGSYTVVAGNPAVKIKERIITE